MKKLLILIFIEIVFTNAVYCSLVDTITAKTIAVNFYLAKASQSKIQHVRSLVSKQILMELVHQEFENENNQNNSEPYYYVYNVQANNGFIIVSADDNVTPVLGFAFEGKFEIDNQPPALMEWMNGYKKQIKYIKAIQPMLSNKIKSAGVKIKSFLESETNINEVSPLLGSISWDQGTYYNQYCPNDNQTNCSDGKSIPNPDGHVYTGCTATAMGQIMKFWKWPKIGYGSHTDTNYFNGVPKTVNFGESSYNWTLMPDKISDYNSEIATILYHAGVAANSNYGACGTDATTDDARIALVEHFRYNSNAKIINNYILTPESTWKTSIINELNAGRPVLYRGDNNGKRGHIFVCDGYIGSNYFHFNWGWSGNGNQVYLYLNNIINDTYSISFNDSQQAIIEIIPDAADLIPINQSLSATSVQAGSNISASCVEDNSGSVAAGAHLISIYLSKDSIFSLDVNSKIYLGKFYLSGLAAGSCSLLLTKSIQIPSNALSGNYYVNFYSDGSQVIDEFNEDNNYASVKLVVTGQTIDNPPTKSITRLEYFMDTDPGFGNGIALNISTPNDIDGDFNISLNNISDGFHILYFRAKDNNGNWSITSNSVFYKTDKSSPDIVKMEYFLDTDPGFDSASLVPIIKNTNINKNINIDLSNVKNGFHTLFIRTKNVLDKWSVTSNAAFYKMMSNLNGITKLEYFFDFDPGFDFGTVIPIIPAKSNITKQFNVDLACLSIGSHTFNVRAKDDLGIWSLIYSKNFIVTSTTPIITQNGNVLHSNVSNGNQWYNQNGIITDAINQDYVVSSNGEYYVIVTHSGCSLEKSNTIQIFISEIEQTELNNSIHIYPNPTTENFKVNGLTGKVLLILTDINGIEILTRKVTDNESISVNTLPKGVYIVKIITDEGTVERKLIKK